MRTLYTLLILVLNVSFVDAQVTRALKKIDDTAVPSIIIKKFNKIAPMGQQVSWTYEHTTQNAGPAFDFYHSEFIQNDNPGSTTFDGDGQLLDFRVNAKLDTLPSTVQRTIKRQFDTVKKKYPNVVMDICALGDTQENSAMHKEMLELTYIIEFYKSAKTRLKLERLSFGTEIDSNGNVIQKPKGHFSDWR